MQYEEEKALTEYLWENYSDLIDPAMHAINNSLTRLALRSSSSSSRTAPPQESDEIAKLLSNAEVRAALQAGPDAFRGRVARDVLAIYAEEVQIVRCAKCRKLLKSPESKHCYWCGHDWHLR